jgi:glycosyltransferase involved in cell wall biosynthesis
MISDARITVAIPTRNRRGYLVRAIESAINTRQAGIEVLVSDNASTDGTFELAEPYRMRGVRWFRHDADLGMVGNWNFCLRQASGEYFLLLSDDDELTPESLQVLRLALDEPVGPAGTAFAYGAVDVVNSSGGLLTRGHTGAPTENYHQFLDLWLCGKRSIYPCATLFRRADLLAVEGYCERYGGFADVGAWLSLSRVRPHGVIRFVNTTVARYRTHDSNLSGSEHVAQDLRSLDYLIGDFRPSFPREFAKRSRQVRASFIASKLRVLSKTGGVRPHVEYVRQVFSHWELVRTHCALEPFFRNWLILASPRLYEVYKKRRQPLGVRSLDDAGP